MIRGPVILLGGGGHALVVADAIVARGGTIAGVIDDNPGCSVVERKDVPHLGTIKDLLDGSAPTVGPLVLCVGDLDLRRRIISTLDADTVINHVIHPSAVVAPSARLALGVFIGPLAVVHSFAPVGAHSIINSGAIVEHECMIGANVHVAPGAVLGGAVNVAADCLIGLGSIVLPGLSVGRGSTIGAGAVVVRNVPLAATVVGIPARVRSLLPVLKGKAVTWAKKTGAKKTGTKKAGAKQAPAKRAARSASRARGRGR